MRASSNSGSMHIIIVSEYSGGGEEEEEDIIISIWATHIHITLLIEVAHK